MELPINRDPQDLNKSFFEGKKWWQYLCIGLAFVIAILFTLILGPKLDPSLNGIICSVLVVPLGYIGLFQRNGLDLFEYYRAKRVSNKVFLNIVEPYKPKVIKTDEKKKKISRRK